MTAITIVNPNAQSLSGWTLTNVPSIIFLEDNAGVASGVGVPPSPATLWAPTTTPGVGTPVFSGGTPNQVSTITQTIDVPPVEVATVTTGAIREVKMTVSVGGLIGNSPVSLKLVFINSLGQSTGTAETGIIYSSLGNFRDIFISKILHPDVEKIRYEISWPEGYDELWVTNVRAIIDNPNTTTVLNRPVTTASGWEVPYGQLTSRTTDPSPETPDVNYAYLEYEGTTSSNTKGTTARAILNYPLSAVDLTELNSNGTSGCTLVMRIAKDSVDISLSEGMGVKVTAFDIHGNQLDEDISLPHDNVKHTWEGLTLTLQPLGIDVRLIRIQLDSKWVSGFKSNSFINNTELTFYKLEDAQSDLNDYITDDTILFPSPNSPALLTTVGVPTAALLGVTTFDALKANNTYEVVSEQILGSCKWRAFVDDYYYRVYIIPDTIDVGAIEEDTVVSYQVWNAYFSPTSNVAVSYNGTVLGFDETQLPVNFQALELKDYQATVKSVGEDVNAVLLHNFTTVGVSEVYPLRIRALDSALFPIEGRCPDMTNPVEMTYEFKTEIIESRDGTEQRRAFRRLPRRTLSFSTWSRAHKQFLFLNQWGQKTVVAANIAEHADLTFSGGVAVVDKLLPWMLVGNIVAVRLPGKDSISRITKVDVANKKVFISLIVSGEYKVYSTISGRMLSASHVRDTAIVGDMAVEIIENTGSWDYKLEGHGGDFYNGVPVLGACPDGDSGNSMDYDPRWEIIDYGSSAQYFKPKSSLTTMSFTFSFFTKTQADAILDLYLSVKGRAGEFYVPTWNSDVISETTLIDTTSGFVVKGLDFKKAYADSRYYKKLAFRNGKTWVIRAVIGVSDFNGDTNVVLDQELGFTMQKDAIISWAHRCRLGSDDLTLSWDTDSTGSAVLECVVLADV